MKFPYGIADFHKLITTGFFYADRTGHIPAIEDAGEQLLFLRPRRFGKSLLLSMLENYYDLARADQFDRLFGRLAIGQNPTPMHNQYFVMKWDFSAVEAAGAPDQVRDALHRHVNQRIQRFAEYYQAHLPRPIQIEPKDALASFQSLLGAVQLTPHKLYLLIDEYDNFANEILMGGQPASRPNYDGLLRGEGALKAIFKLVKAAAAGWGLDRVFITGVAPIVLSDLTSGYNVAENISLDSQFYDLCGFTEAEVRQAITGGGLSAAEAEKALVRMRQSYNGYRFSEESADLIYNPTLALYFLKRLRTKGRPPANLLDGNLAMDRGKLSYVAQLPGGARVIVDALQNEAELTVPQLADRFGVEDMLTARKDTTFMASLLYYFGVLTLAGRNVYLDLQLQIPNLVIRKLYLERLRALLLPEDADQQDGRRAALALQRRGDPQPLCEFIEQRYFKAFSNRDYLYANEFTVKTVFLTLLFNDQLYLMESETAAGRRHADLTAIVQPEARQSQAFDLLLEFKFVKPGDLKLSGEQLRGMSRAELAALPQVVAHLADARTQATDYLRGIRRRYPAELRMQAFAVVAIGFERLVWEPIETAS